MALKLAQKKTTAQAPSVDELRKKHAFGTIERMRLELRLFSDQERAARDSANAVNRQKTQLRKAFAAFKTERDLKPEDALVFGDTEYLLDVAYADVVDPEKVYRYLQEGKITEQQFLAAISVPKEQAKLSLGAHITDELTYVKAGKEIDIRKRPAEEATDDLYIKRVSEPLVRNAKVSKPASTVSPVSATSTVRRAGALRIRRRIFT